MTDVDGILSDSIIQNSIMKNKLSSFQFKRIREKEAERLDTARRYSIHKHYPAGPGSSCLFILCFFSPSLPNDFFICRSSHFW